MDYVFAPKTLLEAWTFYKEIPMYSFSDFLKRKKLVFKKNEIIALEEYEANSEYYVVFYSTQMLDGFFYQKKDVVLNVFGSDFSSLMRKSSSNIFKNLIKAIFTFQSPIFWSILFSAAYGFICINYGGYVFPGLTRPELYSSAFCGVRCVKLASLALSALILIYGITLGNLLIGFYFLFGTSKIRNAFNLSFNRSTSLLLILVSLINAGMILEISLKDNNFKKTIIMFRLAYTPEYFKNPINRKIASEIMGAEIKEKKNSK